MGALTIARERLDARTELLRFAPPLTWDELIAGWQHDDALRDALTSALCASPFDAFFWETPPVSWETRGEPFECVLVESRALASVGAQPDAFEAHFAPREPVATFENLRGDAVLIAPAPRSAEASYAHLAAFLRSASASQARALWCAVGRALDERLERDAPCWVSTSGLGVHWLHVRLDDQPKYYSHAPYRDASAR